MTGLVLWIVRVIVLLLVIRLIVRIVSSMMVGHRQVTRSTPRVPERAGGSLVRDPQCGTYIPEARAIVLGRGPDALHFCSPACRDNWTAAHGRARAKA